MIKAYVLRVRRNESVTVEATYPAWELPILEAVHPETTVVSETTIDRDPPGAEEEYTRLENRYKHSTDENGAKSLAFVAAVYGQFNGGVQRLQAAIDAATVGEHAPAHDVDALMGDAA